MGVNLLGQSFRNTHVKSLCCTQIYMVLYVHYVSKKLEEKNVNFFQKC